MLNAYTFHKLARVATLNHLLAVRKCFYFRKAIFNEILRKPPDNLTKNNKLNACEE